MCCIKKGRSVSATLKKKEFYFLAKVVSKIFSVVPKQKFLGI